MTLRSQDSLIGQLNQLSQLSQKLWVVECLMLYKVVCIDKTHILVTLPYHSYCGASLHHLQHFWELFKDYGSTVLHVVVYIIFRQPETVDYVLRRALRYIALSACLEGFLSIDESHS